MKNQIETIHAAKTWPERVKIAQDILPGTPFDEMIERAQMAISMEELGHKGIASEVYQALGKRLALTIKNRQVTVLNEMAVAIGVWKRHKPKPNFELIALFSVSGMFPPGWTKTWGKGLDTKTRRMVTICKLPPGSRDIVAMRDIKKSLATHDRNFSEEKWVNSRRKIQPRRF